MFLPLSGTCFPDLSLPDQYFGDFPHLMPLGFGEVALFVFAVHRQQEQGDAFAVIEVDHPHTATFAGATPLLAQFAYPTGFPNQVAGFGVTCQTPDDVFPLGNTKQEFCPLLVVGQFNNGMH